MQERSWPTYSLVLNFLLFLDNEEHIRANTILDTIWGYQKSSLGVKTENFDQQVQVLFDTVFKPKRRPKKRLMDINGFLSLREVEPDFLKDDIKRLYQLGLIEEFKTSSGSLKIFLTPEGLAVLHGYSQFLEKDSEYDTNVLKSRFEILEHFYKDIVRNELKKLERKINIRPTLPFARISTLLWILLSNPLGEKNKIEITEQYEVISREAVEKFNWVIEEKNTSPFYKESLLDFVSHTSLETGNSIEIIRTRDTNYLYIPEEEFESLIDQIGMSIAKKDEVVFWKGWHELKKEFMNSYIALKQLQKSHHTPEWERELDKLLRKSVANFRRD